MQTINTKSYLSIFQNPTTTPYKRSKLPGAMFRPFNAGKE
jgi:hypothetical protein